MLKPKSLSIKDFLIRKMSIKKMLPEETIEAIINNQFQEANNAMKTCNSVEFSGFGKFLFNKKKSLTKLTTLYNVRANIVEQLEDESLAELKKLSLESKLRIAEKAIENLKPRVDEIKRNL